MTTLHKRTISKFCSKIKIQNNRRTIIFKLMELSIYNNKFDKDILELIFYIWGSKKLFELLKFFVDSPLCRKETVYTETIKLILGISQLDEQKITNFIYNNENDNANYENWIEFTSGDAIVYKYFLVKASIFLFKKKFVY